jgi:hypothetical protein
LTPFLKRGNFYYSMSHFLEDEWRGLEPEQPQPSRGWLVSGLLAAAFLLSVICGLSTLLFYERTGQLPVVPSLPSLVGPGAETPTIEAPTPDDAPTPTELALAPTATLGAPVAGSNVDAGRAVAPPLIDGDLTEWAGPAVDSAFQVYSVEGWDGSDDLEASWQLNWDAENLYLAVSVTDDIHVQTQTGNQIFLGDHVDLQIDSDREGDYAPAVSPDDFQINLSPGDFAGLPPSAFRFQGNSAGSMVDAPGHGMVVTARQAGQGYTLEAAIPWRDLNVTPQPGMVLGVALNVSDNDTPGTAVQEVMKSHVPTRRFADPTSWGTLTLQAQ